jgi:hypothetical protein
MNEIKGKDWGRGHPKIYFHALLEVSEQVEIALMLLTYNQVLSLNAGQGSGYLAWGFSLFSTVPPGKYWDIT